MTEGKASTPQRFWDAANEFGFTFNWAYVSRAGDGLLLAPASCPGAPAASTAACRHSAPATTSGRAILSEDEHPHDVFGPGGLLLNWNNQSAPGFMHGDDEPYGSVHRVELFDKWPRRAQITDNVGIMNRAATEDVRSPVWPVVSQVLHGGPAPERPRPAGRRHPRRLGRPRRAAPRRRRRQPLRRAGPGDHGRRLAADRRRGDVAGVPAACSATSTTSAASAASRASPTSTRTCARCSATGCEGRFNLSYCGNGSLAACRDIAVGGGPLRGRRPGGAVRDVRPDEVADDRVDHGVRPRPAARTRFPTTNRPTFQQVLEFQNPWNHWGWGH